jgi:Helix-turn-helix domain
MAATRTAARGTAETRRRSCAPGARSDLPVRTLRSALGSALIEDDGSRPIEVPGAFLDALADRLASRLAGWMAGQFGLPARLEGSPWMTFEEAVEYTRVPTGTFRKLSADGTFAAHGGKRKVYNRQELDAALAGYAGRRQRR